MWVTLSLWPFNDLGFYYLGWWDIHKDMLCQQDDKRVSFLVLIRLLERSSKSKRIPGRPLHSLECAARHRVAEWDWWRMYKATGSLMAAYYTGFLQHERLCMSFSRTHFRPQYHYRKLTGIRGFLWQNQQLSSLQWLPQDGSLCQEKSYLVLRTRWLWHMRLCRGCVFVTVATVRM